MARALSLLIVLTALATSALAATNNQTYASLPANYALGIEVVQNDDALRVPCNIETDPSCKTEISIPEKDVLIVTYNVLSNYTVNPTSTVTLKACFSKENTVDRPWRKPSPTISLDKQCSYTIAKGLPPQGTYTFTPGQNTAPSTYYVMVLEICAGGLYCGMGRTTGYYTVIPVESRPSWLMALVGTFCCVGPITLVSFFVWEQYSKKRK